MPILLFQIPPGIFTPIRNPNSAYTRSMATFANPTGYDPGLPAAVDAEKTILGAILIENAFHSEAAEKLEPDDFSLDSHRRIYQRMGDLLAEQRPIDIVTLSNELARYKEIESVGGVAYLASLTEGLPRRRPVRARTRRPRSSRSRPARSQRKKHRRRLPVPRPDRGRLLRLHRQSL